MGHTSRNNHYDENGNLKKLRRYARIDGVPSVLDNLNYNGFGSTSVTNQLRTVEDTGNQNVGFINGANGQATEYYYDANGNMKEDMNNAVTLVEYNYLDLPERVVINGGTGSETSVEFLYDASGYLLRKVYKRGTYEESRIDYVNGVQYTNSSLALVFTPHGRVTKYNNTWEYEYFLKDHQGSTRLVFGYLHEVNTYRATMEVYYYAQENTDFNKVSSTGYTDVAPYLYNHTSQSANVPVPNKSARLNGSEIGREVGPGKELLINSGEKLRMEVFARYNPGSGNTSDVVGSLVAAATTSMNVTPSETPLAYSAFNTYLPGFVDGVSYNPGEPKAYLNYILFDAAFSATPQFGYVSIPSSSAVKWEKLAMEITVPAGFNGGVAYVYLTNESNYNVFFDDFLIIHEKPSMALRATESADYYPFGLLIEGTRYVDEGRLANAYGYQGDYSEFDSRTGWNRFELRGNYDSRLARWNSTDPYGQYPSPYVAFGNNPAFFVDPDGGFALNLGAGLARALEGFVAGGIIGLSFDKDNWLKYAGIGAAVGMIWGLASPMVDMGSETATVLDKFRANFEYTFTGKEGMIVSKTPLGARKEYNYKPPFHEIRYINENYGASFDKLYRKPIKKWLKQSREDWAVEIVDKIKAMGLPRIRDARTGATMRPTSVGVGSQRYPVPIKSQWGDKFNPDPNKKEYVNPGNIRLKSARGRVMIIRFPAKHQVPPPQPHQDITVTIEIGFQKVR